jgi:acetylornithine deacetylase/succinyl-diaminopimelate desuccinylase-like protein
MVPGENEPEALAEVSAVLDELRRMNPSLQVAVERTLPTTGPPSELEPDHPLVGIALEAAGRALGSPSRVHGLSGACDMTHFRAAGVPCVVMGPGDESQAHQPDEHMEVEELNRGALAYALTAVAACGLAS